MFALTAIIVDGRAFSVAGKGVVELPPESIPSLRVEPLADDGVAVAEIEEVRLCEPSALPARRTGDDDRPQLAIEQAKDEALPAIVGERDGDRHDAAASAGGPAESIR